MVGPDPSRERKDRDAADLQRWILQQAARRLLMRVEERDWRIKVPYTEIAWLPDLSPVPRRVAPVRDRYRLEVRCELLGGSWEPVQALAVRHRVCLCSRQKIAKDVQPEIWRSRPDESGLVRASFHKVVVCGSVWTCTVCSPRIGLRRQDHIRTAYDLLLNAAPWASDVHSRKEYRWADALMVTFTIRHGAGDSLAGLFAKLKLADGRYLQTSYAYKCLVGYTHVKKGRRLSVPSTLGYVGRISATEITYGDRGWHPHSHQLWFFDQRLTPRDIESLRSTLFREWLKACAAVDLPLPLEFTPGDPESSKPLGVDCRRALSAEEYLSKFGHERDWGPERELASHHVKGGRRGGRTPFRLLQDYASGDVRAGELFVAYAEATRGRHQLEFSKGLKRRLRESGFSDIDATDEELAARLGEDSDLFAQLTDADFEALSNLEKCEGHPMQFFEPFGYVLHLAKYSGIHTVLTWIRSLPSYSQFSNPAK